MKDQEIKKILESFRWPIVLVALLWLVKIYETSSGNFLVEYGLYPRSFEGLRGIFLSLFIHGDWKHLFNNSVPLLLLGWSLFFFYKEIAWNVLLSVILMGGFWTWISARESFHIGASGLVYGMFSFLLFSGFIRRNKRVLSISFLVAFLYGSLVWGLLPIDFKTSWESHLWGFIAGFAMAIYYRRIGIQKEVHQWNEVEEALFEQMDFWKSDEQKKQESDQT